VKELLSRGHQIVALVRTEGSGAEPGTTEFVDDLSDAATTATNIAGADALVSAYAPPPEATDELVAVTRRLVEAVAQSDCPRLLVVGGAGTLEVAPGLTLLDSGYLPPEWRGIAESHAKTLEMLTEAKIDWTYFAPAGYFDPGERTGKFRMGTDTLISDPSGQSRISMEDYAIAMADELEQPKHRGGGRMTIGY
jgi:putative NADH-flavin reductase